MNKINKIKISWDLPFTEVVPKEKHVSTACARSAGDAEKVQGIAAALREAQGPHLFPMPFDVHLDSILKKRQGTHGAGNCIKNKSTIK